MKIAPILSAAHRADELRQLTVCERYMGLWRDRYPHWLSVMGSSPRPEVVEKSSKLVFCRIPAPALGFSLWGFRTEADLRQFLTLLPGFTKPRA